MKWQVIWSTISFGKRIEIPGGFVWGETAEQALQQAESYGMTRVLGFKFDRVELTA